MSKSDLHVHSIYSERPSDWFLQRLGAQESYTDPETIYRKAKENGMTYVTITDHNRIDGALLLKKNHPEDTFVSMEATTYFPEDGCKIHILLYDITEEQFLIIQELRKNIYDLRRYIIDENIAYSLAHATYSVNNKLTLDHIEKLILLFDVFEVINGARSKRSNNLWHTVLTGLTPEIINDLKIKHNIDPASDKPWIKGFTGGSDDHADFFISKTYTETQANSVKEFINNIKNKSTTAAGRNNDFRGLAFSIYKIAYDYTKSNSLNLPNGITSYINELLFEKNKLTIWDKLKCRKFKKNKNKEFSEIKKTFFELLNDIYNVEFIDIEQRLDVVYEKVSLISDIFIKNVLISIKTDLKKGNFFKILNNFAMFLSGIFLSGPFISTFKHMFSDRNLLGDIKTRFEIDDGAEKKILWFTDTINDLNGVSHTLKQIAGLAYKKNKNIKIVSCYSEKETDGAINPNIINLKEIFKFKLPAYEKLKIRLPSVLSSLKEISDQNPDEIYISTPGPIGLLGLLAANLLKVKAVGVYHTDFTLQSKEILNDDTVVNLIERYTKWFYSAMDAIEVPTNEYINVLTERGFDKNKMEIFKRGIDWSMFSPNKKAGENFLEKNSIKKGFNLLFTGRISKDKNLDFLMEVYKEVLRDNKETNLIIAGNGPYLPKLKNKMKDYKRVYFIGEIKRENLPEVYSGADLFVFPSNTDTYGMSVLEAQSCGLPALVSDIGGPKEIIVNYVTGYVVESNDVKHWRKKIINMIKLHDYSPDLYDKICADSRRNAIENYNWDSIINNFVKYNRSYPINNKLKANLQ
ncbi:MAG TPA: glycosyltransferase [Spirochaetota bacterium]|jgi:glycosyltransferase involved in cell wall biosynthesis|nr:MAG: GDP-mannose-dependent alpha-(1-6)-phosphatidylinositol monomannoside mannosyltransferase [Spirochaetes bacterium ADurb.Bin133]HPY87560.1 glycosyltransferase [Spirochaetota bacterium]HQB60202.1 glycosyltransferase [Spirochaetota bacterium]